MPGLIHNLALMAIRAGLVPNPMQKALEKGFVFRTSPTDAHLKSFDIGLGEFHREKVYTFGVPQDGDPILYFGHGGGFVAGMFLTYYEAIGRLYKQLGFPVIAPDYPMPPDVEASQTREWTLAHFRDVLATYPNSPIIVAGDSAGANLVVALVQGLKPAERQRISSLFALYAWLDLTRQEHDYPNHKEEVLLRADLIGLAAKRFAKDVPLHDPSISPLFGPVSDLPPVHIITGDKDMLHQESLEFERKLKDAGAAVRMTNHVGYGHDFWLFPTPDGKRETKKMASYMQDAIGR